MDEKVACMCVCVFMRPTREFCETEDLQFICGNQPKTDTSLVEAGNMNIEYC